MAHRGRPYPFLPEFWSTYLFYWPYWLPRRILIGGTQVAFDDWDQLNVPGGILSNVGVPSLDFSTVDYDYGVPGGVWFGKVRVQCDPLTYPADGTLTAQLFSGTSIGEAGGAVLTIDAGPLVGYSLPVVMSGGGFVSNRTDLVANFFPATWSQGGGT